MPRRFLALLTLTAAVAGCGSGGTEPEPCPVGVICTPGTPSVARFNFAPGALEQTSVSFWAVKGQDRSAAIFFRGADDDEREELLSFQVGANSLLRDPQGRLYQNGDSVRITITLPDPTRAEFVFAPAGLRFNPADPAELELEYGDASQGDLNGDGLVNATDIAIAAQLAVWLRESANSAFFRVESSFNDDVLDEVEADVLGFTRYALAY